MICCHVLCSLAENILIPLSPHVLPIHSLWMSHVSIVRNICCCCLSFRSIEHDILVGLCCFISLPSQFSQAAGFLTVCQTACCIHVCLCVCHKLGVGGSQKYESVSVTPATIPRWTQSPTRDHSITFFHSIFVLLCILSSLHVRNCALTVHTSEPVIRN